MLGAAEALSHAAATGEITPAQAQDELFETIIAMVDRSARAATLIVSPMRSDVGPTGTHPRNNKAQH